MAREALAPLAHTRRGFRATVARSGCDSAAGLTLLLVGVADDEGRPLADHLWVRLAGPARAARIPFGRRVAFTAVAVPYRRAAGDADYTLAALRDIRAVDGGG